MALTVQALFDAASDKYRLKLLAGRNGTKHPVSWLYYTEDASTIDFIRGGELVLTTGMSRGRQAAANDNSPLQTADEYLEIMINQLYTLGAAGLIVNTGRYITEIPQKTLDLCNKMDFPLFSMPWEIHMIDIMQDYGNRIVREKQKRTTLAQTLYDALFHTERFSPEYLENTGFSNASSYGIILLELPDQLFRADDEELSRYMDYSFNGKLLLGPASFSWFVHDHKIVYVVHENPESIAITINKAAVNDHFFHAMKTAASGICSSVTDLGHEYDHALLALDFCKENQLLTFYRDLGIFKLLAEIKDHRVLEQFYDDVLGKLNILSFDKRGDYLKTLRLYLENGGNVLVTAEKNDIHRNTINYRIRKIRDILNVDLQDGQVRYRIQTALFVHELLKKMA